MTADHDWDAQEELDAGDHNDLVAEARANARYQRQLDRHPSCRDPDHPGCPGCWDDEGEGKA